jgi:hypothetical protein
MSCICDKGVGGCSSIDVVVGPNSCGRINCFSNDSSKLTASISKYLFSLGFRWPSPRGEAFSLHRRFSGGSLADGRVHW